MEKNVIKVYSELFKQEVTLIIDEELEKEKGRMADSPKIQELNESARRNAHLLPR